MTLETVRGPTPSVENQPAEERTFVWRFRLPQFIGPYQSRLPEEEGRVRRVCPRGAPSPHKSVRRARRQDELLNASRQVQVLKQHWDS
jgi:hypothetical protein